jgi:hypothetical protein
MCDTGYQFPPAAKPAWTHRASQMSFINLRIAVRVIRIIFGAHFLFNGLNFFIHFFNIPPPHNPGALAFMGSLIQSGMFNIVKTVEVVTGIAILGNLYVPLALVIAFPVALGVAYVDIVLIGTWFGGWVLGLGTVGLNAALLLAYLRYYRPLLVARSEPGIRQI